MNRCLICFGNIEQSCNNNKVCNKCISKFKEIDKTLYLDGVQVLILYDYNDFFKELLYRYKGCYDLYLKDAFFNNNLIKLRKLYKGRKVICAPSSDDENKKRGFKHLNEIAKSLNLSIIDCLYKTKKYKQSDQKYIQRSNIQKYIKIDKSKLNQEDRLLIFDDVATSLSTIKTIIKQTSTIYDKKVLILASKCRFMENEIN